MPWQITDRGADDPFWTDPAAVKVFMLQHGLPEPHPGYWESPRALRDHAAYTWVKRAGYVTRWGTPDWPRARQVGVGATGSARTRARLSSGIRGT